MQLKSMYPSFNKQTQVVDKSKPFSVRNSESKLKSIEDRLNMSPKLDVLESQLENVLNERKGPNTNLKVRQIEKQANDRYMFEKQYYLEKIKLNKLMEMEQNIKPNDSPEEEIAKISKQYERLKAKIYQILKE